MHVTEGCDLCIHVHKVMVLRLPADACSPVPTASEATSLEEAQGIMTQNQIETLPFVDQDGKLVRR